MKRDAFLDGWSEGWQPAARLTVSQWADQHRKLSSKASPEPGDWRTDRAPYAREPMDSLSVSDPTEVVVLMWGAQTSKTETSNNWLGYIIHHAPGPVMAVQPTVDMAKRLSKQRLADMIETTPALRERVSEARSRDSGNTLLSKEFPGGVLVLAGANSASGLRSMPARYLSLDEVDAYPEDVDNEGDPVALAIKRTSTFGRRRKVLITSTPTVKGRSRVEREFLRSDQRRYFVTCPHCDHRQWLRWRGYTDDKDDPRSKEYRLTWLDEAKTAAGYKCGGCGALIEEHHKTKMLLGGQWVPTAKGDGKTRGYHLSSLYSPLGWTSWVEILREFEQVASDPAQLKVFVNTVLAETWENRGSGADSKVLAARAEPYPLGIVPRGGLMLTMGVDTQPDRLEARVWAYGRGEESWLIERHVIYGDPNLDENTEGSPWTRLTEIRRTAIKTAGGSDMRIEATCIDSGGHNTHAVYSYCRAHAHEKVLAIKGASKYGGPVIGRPSMVDINWRGALLKQGVKLWPIGTDTAKDLLYGRMKIGRVGPGYVHVPDALKATDEFEQMTASRLVPVKVRKATVMRWVTPPGHREEASDCFVYAYAAACYLGIQTFRVSSWNVREERFWPGVPLPDQPPETAPAAQPAAARRPQPAQRHDDAWSFERRD